MKQSSNQKTKLGKTSQTLLNENLQNAIARFYDESVPARVSRNLRRIFFDYLAHEKDALPVDFDLYLNDLANLFELLDALQDDSRFTV